MSIYSARNTLQRVFSLTYKIIVLNLNKKIYLSSEELVLRWVVELASPLAVGVSAVCAYFRMKGSELTLSVSNPSEKLKCDIHLKLKRRKSPTFDVINCKMRCSLSDLRGANNEIIKPLHNFKKEHTPLKRIF